MAGSGHRTSTSVGGLAAIQPYGVPSNREFAVLVFKSPAGNHRTERLGSTTVLTLLTRRLRGRAAILLAIVYAFCVAAAPAAVASVAGPQAPQGVSDAHHVMVKAHAHADANAHHHPDQGMPHDHPDHGDGNGHPGNCCGLLCLTVLGVDVAVSFDHQICGSTIALVVDDGLGSRGPDRLYRPPIAPLSL